MYRVVRNTKDLIVLMDKTTFRARKITYEDLYEMLKKGSCHIDNLSARQRLAVCSGDFNGVVPQEYMDCTKLKILNYEERQSYLSRNILPIYFDYTITQCESHNFTSNDFCIVTIGDSHHIWHDNNYVIVSKYLVSHVFRLEGDVLYVMMANQGNIYSLASIPYMRSPDCYTRQDYLEQISKLKRQNLVD